MTTTVITSTTITLTWSPPADLVPTDYIIQRTCHRLCESNTTTVTVFSVSSPHQSTGIAPYSQCMFTLTAFYGSDGVQVYQSDRSVTTLSAGMILYALLLYLSFSLSSSHYLFC